MTMEKMMAELRTIFGHDELPEHIARLYTIIVLQKDSMSKLSDEEREEIVDWIDSKNVGD